MGNKYTLRGRDLLGIFVGIFLVIAIANAFTVVPAGFAGVKTVFGKVRDVEINEGLNVKMPFVEEIKLVDGRIKKVEVVTSAPSKDMQMISSTIAVNYRVNKEMARNLYKNIGMTYESTVIRPAIIESSKTAMSLYTAEELITKRSEVSVKMKETLKGKLEARGILVEEFNIINFEFSEEFDRAIEAKQTAEQLAQKANRDLERIKIESQQKIELAKAEAESLKLQKQEITKELIELRKIEMMTKAVEKWNGVMPKTMAGEGLNMFISGE